LVRELLKDLLKDLHIKQTKPTVIHEDNQAAIQIAVTTIPQKEQVMDIKYHYVHEKVVDNTIQLEMLADIMIN